MRGGIRTLLDAPLAMRPDAEAVVGRSGRLSFRQLDAAADRAAGALWGLGVRPGDRVAASLPNDVDVVVAFHAAMRIGAVWVGLNEALAAAEMQELLADCTPRLVLATAARLDGLDTAGARGVATGDGEWAGLLDAAEDAPAIDVDPHAPAGIAYTSGTTGHPKGIVHSQHNLMLPGAVLVASRGWGPTLRKGDCLPLTILNLVVLTTLTTAQAGGCCVVMDRRDVDGVAEWIEAERVTHWNGVPAQLHDLATPGRVEPSALASLTEVWSGGADCPDELRDRFAALHGLHVRTTYGLTEAPTVVSIDPVGGERRAGASGQVLPHLQVRAHDPDGTPLPAGEVGELHLAARADGPWARQWTPYLGVWSEGAVVPAGTTQGAVPTGDIGSVDAEGWVRVVDRRKLLIVRGGANVSPAEVERVLAAQPGVAGAAVFGVPDERLGERVAAIVELAPGSSVTVDELRAACGARLARYKVPERWGVAERLPRNAMGKVVRPELPGLLAATGGQR